MCGVIGYKGKQQALPIMQKLMKHLDYRGYDSHGLCFVTKEGFEVHKALGSADTDFSHLNVDSCCAIGHVRWATNGEATIENAHPHVADNLALVHNGIVKNIDDIIINRQYVSNTDTEILAHWLASSTSYAEALSKVKGDYAVLFTLKGQNQLFVACKNIPLYVVRHGGDYYVASSLNVFQEEFEICEYAVIEDCFMELDYIGTASGTIDLHWRFAYGKKETFGVGESYNGSVTLAEIKQQWDYDRSEKFLLDWPKKLVMFGCGSSYNAGLISRYFFRDAGYETEVFIPSELRQIPCFEVQHLAISQSGETKDVLDMCRELKTFDAVVNTEHSTLERMATRTLHLKCGVEKGIAATKTFSATLWSLLYLAMPWRAGYVASLLKEAYPLVFGPLYPSVPASICGFDSVFIFGGGITHYVNLEGALKMKEMAAVHAEAVPAAEVKHGPLVLVNDKTLSIFVLVNDAFDDQIMENISQVTSRGSSVLVLTNNDRKYPGDVIRMPDLRDYIANAFVATVYLQLIAWEFGSLRGANIDRPPNLAKCVTV